MKPSSMDFKPVLEIYNLHKADIKNEAQTRQYLVAPILNMLGYNLMNPKEVIPEFTADVAGKKNEKIDYAIKKNDKIVILIECKPINNKLERKDREQLERYFNCRLEVDDARVGILTNGVVWKFYSNTIHASTIDQEPFYVFDLTDSETYSKMLHFTSDAFDSETVFQNAKMRHQVSSIKNFFDEIFSCGINTPLDTSGKIVRAMSHFIDFDGRITDSKIKDLMEPFVVAREEFIKEYVMKKISSNNSRPQEINTELAMFTEEEKQCYNMILSIAAEAIDVEKLEHRNRSGKGNSSILFNGSQRTPVLHMFFSGSNKLIAVGSESINLEKLSDIFKYKHKVLDQIKLYAA